MPAVRTPPFDDDSAFARGPLRNRRAPARALGRRTARARRPRPGRARLPFAPLDSIAGTAVARSSVRVRADGFDVRCPLVYPALLFVSGDSRGPIPRERRAWRSAGSRSILATWLMGVWSAQHTAVCSNPRQLGSAFRPPRPPRALETVADASAGCPRPPRFACPSYLAASSVFPSHPRPPSLATLPSPSVLFSLLHCPCCASKLRPRSLRYSPQRQRFRSIRAFRISSGEWTAAPFASTSAHSHSLSAPAVQNANKLQRVGAGRTSAQVG